MFCCDKLSCALDIMECIFHMMLHNKPPSCCCAGLTLLQHPHCIPTIANIKAETVFRLLVKFSGQIQCTLQISSVFVLNEHAWSNPYNLKLDMKGPIILILLAS